MTSVSCRTMICTWALAPRCSPAGIPVTSMVTGYVATPELWVGSRPTVDTVPNSVVVAPFGVMTDWLPVLIWPIWVSSTLVLIL